MARKVETRQASITLEFSLDEARRIMDVAEGQAKECENWTIVNALSELRRFVEREGK